MDRFWSASVPNFLVKLWKIVDDTVVKDVIRWSEVKSCVGSKMGFREGLSKMWKDFRKGPEPKHKDLFSDGMVFWQPNFLHKITLTSLISV
jgi:hypothetical protein